MELLDKKSEPEIRVIYKSRQFEAFFDALSERVKAKFEYAFAVIQSVYVLPTKYVKHLENTDLYEMRVSVGSNEYRTILFALDHANVIQATKIILLNGFLKKSSKDYKKQVEIANKILEELR